MPKPAKPDIVRFRVALRHVSPPVWRRIEVPASYDFWELHVAIQDAMGWTDSHLHVFRINNPRTGTVDDIGIPDDDQFMDGPFSLPGWKTPIAKYFAAIGAKAKYAYDFGDGWEHDVTLEAKVAREPDVMYPRCVAGRRACPPEDCGGPPGFEELRRVIDDPTDPEHASMMEWLGGSYDPAHFDARNVQFDDPQARWEFAFRP